MWNGHGGEMTYTSKNVVLTTRVQVYSKGVQYVHHFSLRTTVLYIQARQIRCETDKYAVYRPSIK